MVTCMVKTMQVTMQVNYHSEYTNKVILNIQ